MELEELKKSWNVLDEHLKDKELIKEEELSKLLGHTGKGIHAKGAGCRRGRCLRRYGNH